MEVMVFMGGERKGKWLETYCGRFWVLDPREEDVYLEDIAHALSQMCRFTGHTRYFYSVAQHCLNMLYVSKKMKYDEKIQFYGLLHDSPEIFICDIPNPFKKMIPEYKKIEEGIEKVIYNSFGLPYPDEAVRKVIEKLDWDLCVAEGKALMSNKGNWIDDHPYDEVNIDTSIRKMLDVKSEFIDQSQQLIKKLGLKPKAKIPRGF
jgi:uncharacterized protein